MHPVRRRIANRLLGTVEFEIYCLPPKIILNLKTLLEMTRILIFFLKRGNILNSNCSGGVHADLDGHRHRRLPLAVGRRPRSDYRSQHSGRDLRLIEIFIWYFLEKILNYRIPDVDRSVHRFRHARRLPYLPVSYRTLPVIDNWLIVR